MEEQRQKNIKTAIAFGLGMLVLGLLGIILLGGQGTAQTATIAAPAKTIDTITAAPSCGASCSGGCGGACGSAGCGCGCGGK
jgi:hypothetical protein